MRNCTSNTQLCQKSIERSKLWTDQDVDTLVNSIQDILLLFGRRRLSLLPLGYELISFSIS